MPEQDLFSVKPFRAVGFLLSSLGYATSRGFHRRLASLDLDPRAFAVLRSVGFTEGQTQQALASALAIPASRMVAILDGLEARGLLERRLRDEDRRSRAVHLTDAGRDLAKRAIQIAAGYESWLCEGLSDEERTQLMDLLDRVAGQLGVLPGVHEASRRDEDPLHDD